MKAREHREKIGLQAPPRDSARDTPLPLISTSLTLIRPTAAALIDDYNKPVGHERIHTCTKQSCGTMEHDADGRRVTRNEVRASGDKKVYLNAGRR